VESRQYERFASAAPAFAPIHVAYHHGKSLVMRSGPQRCFCPEP